MIYFDCVNKTVLFLQIQVKLFIGKTPQNHLQTLRSYSSLKPYHKTYIILCRFVQCIHNQHIFMKYTQIFVCIIARGQIARDRAMGPYFIGNMAWRAFWGRGDFLRDQLVWV